MMVTLVFMALLMFGFAGWLISRTVAVQPWVATGGTATTPAPAAITGPRVGLVVFLAVVTSLFALTISAYTMRMGAAAPDAASLPRPAGLWLNTALLLAASAALQFAWHAARRGAVLGVRLGLAAAVGTSVAFLVGQYGVWLALRDAGFYLQTHPASAFFALMTTLHAVHLLGGLGALARVVLRAARGDPPLQVRQALGLCAVYWHYLFVVWVVLFGVLFIGALPLHAPSHVH